VFPGEGGTVFVMDVNSNVNGLHSEPGFHPEARYEFKVHVDGADIETLTYPGCPWTWCWRAGPARPAISGGS
jgi:hypothetical protein